MASAFNEAELLERVDNDVGFLAETVEMLETDGRKLMTDVRQGVAAGDAAGVGRAAHALKGMISNFCAPQSQEAALNVERMGKSSDLAGASEAADKLATMLEVLITELQQFVKARV